MLVTSKGFSGNNGNMEVFQEVLRQFMWCSNDASRGASAKNSTDIRKGVKRAGRHAAGHPGHCIQPTDHDFATAIEFSDHLFRKGLAKP